MRFGRRASNVRNKFQLVELAPARARADRRQRIEPEPVGTSGPSQPKQLKDAPNGQTEPDRADEQRQMRVVEPIPQQVEKAWSNQERDNPPAAFVAVVEPLPEK